MKCIEPIALQMNLNDHKLQSAEALRGARNESRILAELMRKSLDKQIEKAIEEIELLLASSLTFAMP